MGWYDRRLRRVRDLSSAGFRIVLELEVRRIECGACACVKRERLDFLADNPHFTKRFAFYVGRRCRQAAIRDVAKELKLDWETVKTLEMQYMRAQIERAGAPGPRAIGVDEISIRKGHVYRIVVSDLARKRPIWFGGEDRSETSMAQFYAWLGPRKCSKIRLVVMDMWKPFRNVAREKAPQAAILFDKVPHHAPSRRGARQGAQGRICPPRRQGSALHQRPEVHAAVASREPHPGGQALAPTPAGRQQASQYRLRPEGGLRSTMGLPARELGAPILRQLARQSEMAAPQTLRALRRHDRSALGRHRRLLQTGEQGFSRLRRGPQQQDPRVSTTRLRTERRGISPPQGPLLHAPAALTPQNRPLDLQKTQNILDRKHRHSPSTDEFDDARPLYHQAAFRARPEQGEGILDPKPHGGALSLLFWRGRARLGP